MACHLPDHGQATAQTQVTYSSQIDTHLRGSQAPARTECWPPPAVGHARHPAAPAFGAQTPAAPGSESGLRADSPGRRALPTAHLRPVQPGVLQGQTEQPAEPCVVGD